MADVEDNKESNFDGMSILLIILAVIVIVVILALIFTYAGPAVMDVLMNAFGSGPEYQLSDAFGIVN